MVSLEVLRQPSVPVDPCEEPLDHPAACDHGKADLVVSLAHHLDADGACLGDPRTGISTVCKAQRHKGPAWARGPQQRPGPVAILDIGRMGLELERPTIRVHHGVALTALDPLAGVIAAYPSGERRVGVQATPTTARWFGARQFQGSISWSRVTG